MRCFRLRESCQNVTSIITKVMSYSLCKLAGRIDIAKDHICKGIATLDSVIVGPYKSPNLISPGSHIKRTSCYHNYHKIRTYLKKLFYELILLIRNIHVYPVYSFRIKIVIDSAYEYNLLIRRILGHRQGFLTELSTKL